MRSTDLRWFDAFGELPRARLEAVARQSRQLRVPAHRWLVRPGRNLPTHFFLLEGRIRLLQEGRSVIVSAGSRRARRAVYPGAAAVQTLTEAAFLSVDPGVLASEPPAPDRHPGVPEVTAGVSWQQRFLESPLMQRLDPPAWQRILRAMRGEWHRAGSVVLEAGQPGDRCYVLCSGNAEIRAPGDGRFLAALAPGSLFGEDALISGRARNASVVMTADGQVMGLPAGQFQTWLLDAVVQPLPEPGPRTPLCLDGTGPVTARRLSLSHIRHAGKLLSPRKSYAVIGGTAAERALATFLLAEQGIDAAPVAAIT